MHEPVRIFLHDATTLLVVVVAGAALLAFGIAYVAAEVVRVVGS